jgi:hypothetical protein
MSEEVEQVSNTEVVNTSTESSAAEVTPPTDERGGTKVEAQAVSSWTPNYKYKVKDKELEFDEDIRPLITKKEQEDKLRDLYSRAYGLDEVKADRQSLKEKNAEISQKYEGITKSLKTLGEFVKKRDYRTFFESLEIPKEQIIQFALDELKYLELPEEEQQRIEAERDMQARLAQYEEQTTTLQQQQAQLVAQQVNRELSYELERPEVAQMIQAFDTRVGKPGAFREEVLKRGAYYEAIHKQSPPTKQVIDEVMQLVGNQMGGIESAHAAVNSPGTAAKKPVIPSFSGASGASPTRKVPTSVEDLRKMRAAMVAQQG